MCNAQKVLVLEKIGKKKRIRFQMGDELKVKIGADQMLIVGDLGLFSDSAIYVANNLIPIDSIHSVYVGKQRTLARLGKGLGLVGGTAYLGISIINGLATKNYDHFGRSTVYVVPAAFALYGIIALTEKNWFTPSEKRKISIKDHNPL